MKNVVENKKDGGEVQAEYNRVALQNVYTEEDRKYDFKVLDFMRLKKTELNCLVKNQNLYFLMKIN